MGRNNFITFDDLSKLWKVPDFCVLEYIKKGLPAYDRLGRLTITEAEIEYKPEETIEEFSQRIYLRERNAEQLRIEKINSAEYRFNIERLQQEKDDSGKYLCNAPLLGAELPAYEVYDENKIMKRVKSRVNQEYDQLESFPSVPPDRRLILSKLGDSELTELLNEMQTFLFKCEDVNQFAKDHRLPLIDDGTGKDNQKMDKGKVLVRREVALAIAKRIKQADQNCKISSAVKEINRCLHENGLSGYSDKHLRRMIGSLGFTLGKPGRKPTK